MRPTGARSGRLFPIPALLLLVGLVAVVLLGCAGRQGLGASQSWSGVAVQSDGGTGYVGTRDGRIIEVEIEVDGRGGLRLQPRAEFDSGSDNRLEESRGNRVASAFYGTPTLADGRVYAGSYQGFVYSLSEDLDDIGEFEIEGELLAKGISGSVVVADGRVVVAASENAETGRLYVLDKAMLDADEDDEDILRAGCRYPAGGAEAIGPIWSTPTVVDGIAYFGDLHHFIHAVTITDCKLIWDTPTKLGGALVAPPLVVGGRLYIGSFDRSLYGISLTSGAATKLFTADNWFWAGAGTDGQRVYAPNFDGRLYAYDIQRGELVWSYDQEGDRDRLLSSPIVIDDKIVLASDSGILTLLDATGRRLDRLGTTGDSVRAPLTVFGETVFARSLDEVITPYRVEGQDLDTDTDWELKLEGF